MDVDLDADADSDADSDADTDVVFKDPALMFNWMNLEMHSSWMNRIRRERKGSEGGPRPPGKNIYSSYFQ